MTPGEFRKIVALAVKIAAQSEQDGFVPIKNLARSFGADVEFRPMLVEGMIASPRDPGGRWKVLIDSETYPMPATGIEDEDAAHPLPARLRNTIAHELAHVLGFRALELGLQTDLAKEELVKEIEKETERISPLLLVPMSAVESLCEETKTAVPFDSLVRCRRKHAVSPQVFIQRFELIQFHDPMGIIHSPGLSDMAAGFGKRSSSGNLGIGQTVFNGFRGLAPEFVIRLRDRQTVTVSELFDQERFSLCGENSMGAEVLIPFGTAANPATEKRRVWLEMEAASGSRSAAFLWQVRLIPDTM